MNDITLAGHVENYFVTLSFIDAPTECSGKWFPGTFTSALQCQKPMALAKSNRWSKLFL